MSRNSNSKKLAVSTIALAAATVSSVSPVEAETLVAVSPVLDENTSIEAGQKDLAEIMYSVSDTGDTIPLIDATNGRAIGDYEVSNRNSARKLRGRTNANMHVFAEFKNAANDAEESFGAHGLNLPTIIHSAASDYRLSDGDELIIIGSPLFLSPDFPGWGMADGLVPSDATITARSTHSVYGTAEFGNALNGVRVHILTPPAAEWSENRVHRDGVERFYSLLFAQLGADLITFTDDKHVLARKIQTDAPTHPRWNLDTRDKRLYMRDLSVGPARPTESIFDSPVTNDEITKSDLSAALGAKIGLSWTEQDVDLDLFVMPSATADPIYFSNKITEFGWLRKDHQTAPVEKGMEEINFTKPVDFGQAVIAVNWYAGMPENLPLKGEVRYQNGGKTFAFPFEFHSGTDGNEGAGRAEIIRNGDAPNGYWIVVDLEKLVQPQ